MPGWYSEWRESWSQEGEWRKNPQNMLHIFINIVQFLITVDKCWSKVTICFLYLCILKSGFAANECYESSKLTIK